VRRSLHHLGSFDDAQDAAQEAFVHAYLHLAQLRDPSRFGPWLRRIAANVCQDALRQRGPALPSGSDDDLAAQQAQVAACDNDEQAVARLVVRAALGRLSDPLRLTVTLCYIDGYSHAEVADFLEIPVNTVRSRLRRAKAELREELMDMVEDGLKHEAPTPDFTEQVGQRILLFDEDRALATAGEGELAEAGFEVLCVETGEGLLGELRRQRPQLILLSRHLPGVDGMEVLEALKQSDEFRQLPVIFVMSEPSKEDVHRAWEAGADCFLTKPYDPAELRVFAQRLVERPAEQVSK
jgi:RNA polymerase sigma-70 factor (ECF subfamily)